MDRSYTYELKYNAVYINTLTATIHIPKQNLEARLEKKRKNAFAIMAALLWYIYSWDHIMNGFTDKKINTEQTKFMAKLTQRSQFDRLLGCGYYVRRKKNDFKLLLNVKEILDQ